MTYNPKEIPEHINVSRVHPLVNFASLVGTVMVASAVIYWSLGWVAAQLVTRISPEMEVKIGQQLISTIETTSAQPQQLNYLEELLTSLREPATATRVPLTLHLLDSQNPNAAIVPGGHILVSNALLKEAESENELAFVLAHELGHFVERDPLERLGRSLVFLTLTSALGFGTGNSGSQGIVTFPGYLTDLHYSRQQEKAADLYALSALIRLYGHGGHSLSFLERLKTKEMGGKLPPYFSTHPLTQERIDYLWQIASQRGWSMTGAPTHVLKLTE